MLVSISKRFSTSFEFLASSQFWSHDLLSMTPASAELLAACLLDLGSISAALRGARARFPNSGWKSSLTVHNLVPRARARFRPAVATRPLG